MESALPSSNIRRQWLWKAFALSCLLFAAVPLDWLVPAAAAISPADSILPQSMLALRGAKFALPVLATSIIAWSWLSIAGRRHWAHQIDALLRSRQAPYGVLALSALVRIGVIIIFPTDLYADSGWYFAKGSEIAEGLGYIYDRATQTKTAAWPVGYPAFLGLLFWTLGPHQLVAKLANVPLGVATTYLTHAIGTRLFGPRPALVAAALLSVLPGLAIYTTIVNSDLLFLSMVLLAFRLALSGGERSWPGLGVGLGLVTGLAGLVRPAGIGLTPFWGFLLWLRARGNREGYRYVGMAMGATLIATCAVLLPWTMRNYRVFEKLVVVSTNGGLNLWMGNNPGAAGGYYFPRDPDQNPLLHLVGDELALNERAHELALSFVRQHPRQAIALLPKKMFYLLAGNDSGVYWAQKSALSATQCGTGITLWWVVNLAYALVAALALMGFCLLALDKGRGGLSFAGTAFACYWTAMHLPFFGDNRFMLPLLPFLCIYAGFAVSSLLDAALTAPSSPNRIATAPRPTTSHRSAAAWGKFRLKK